jgi:hypothetical protein
VRLVAASLRHVYAAILLLASCAGIYIALVQVVPIGVQSALSVDNDRIRQELIPGKNRSRQARARKTRVVASKYINSSSGLEGALRNPSG